MAQQRRLYTLFFFFWVLMVGHVLYLCIKLQSKILPSRTSKHHNLKFIQGNKILK